MKNRIARQITVALAAILIAAPMTLSASVETPTPKVAKDLQERVRHELVMLPWYGVFDNIAFQVIDGKVILQGEVTRPTLKSDAGNVVKSIPGVTSVENNIEVLPLSPFDNRIRLNELRAVYGYPTLQRYALGPQAPIRIIVKNGNVTLEGVVASEADRNVANIRANGVPGVFSVTNNLRVNKNG